MSRRDTIIIAVLVNAALLMILFATAMRSDHSKKETKKSPKIGDSRIEELAVQTPVETLNSEDLLSEFVTSVPTLAESGQDNIFSFEGQDLTLAPSPIEIVAAPAVFPPVVEEIKAPKPKIDDQYVNVTVKKGDFLEKIAKANNTTIAAIMKANNLNSTQLKIGQVLKVPLSDGKKAQPKPSSSSQSSHPPEAEYYVVKEGDNPWLIASRNKINLEELLRLNGLDEQKAKRLRPGDKLKIR